jgi:RNA polymerase II subunit A small phosphatase-like protein
VTPILLILDLDETLIHASERALAQPHDFVVGPYFVYRRPSLESFFTECARLYEIAFWSSGGNTYVNSIVEHILPESIRPVFVWSRERCTERLDPYAADTYFLKNLKKIKNRKFDLARVLILEDEPRKVQRNYGNAIYVKSFYGDPNDRELDLLKVYLQGMIHQAEDVRRVEKRDWRLQASGGGNTIF